MKTRPDVPCCACHRSLLSSPWLTTLNIDWSSVAGGIIDFMRIHHLVMACEYYLYISQSVVKAVMKNWIPNKVKAVAMIGWLGHFACMVVHGGSRWHEPKGVGHLTLKLWFIAVQEPTQIFACGSWWFTGIYGSQIRMVHELWFMNHDGSWTVVHGILSWWFMCGSLNWIVCSPVLFKSGRCEFCPQRPFIQGRGWDASKHGREK